MIIRLVDIKLLLFYFWGYYRIVQEKIKKENQKEISFKLINIVNATSTFSHRL